MMEFNPSMERRDYWIKELKKFIPKFLKEHPILRKFSKNASILLHGSITLGFDDPFADIDLWFLLPDKEFVELKKVSESLFFDIEVNDKLGHLNVESIKEFSRRVYELKNGYGQSDMDNIFQLRNAEIILDNTGIGNELINSAIQPMRKEVKDLFFFYHYIEMRSDHRACDNPMERHDPVAFLLSLPKVLAHALKAGMVLDGEPYPYNKWLYYAALRTPTGKKLAPSIDRIIDLIARDNLRFKGSEADNPIGQELRVIRKILVEESQAEGNNSPWLEKWWLYMTQPRDELKNIRW
ncbi:MAG: hypothetical protein ACFFDB_06360 [Promethearchaeota archaeon]